MLPTTIGPLVGLPTDCVHPPLSRLVIKRYRGYTDEESFWVQQHDTWSEEEETSGWAWNERKGLGGGEVGGGGGD